MLTFYFVHQSFLNIRSGSPVAFRPSELWKYSRHRLAPSGSESHCRVSHGRLLCRDRHRSRKYGKILAALAHTFIRFLRLSQDTWLAGFWFLGSATTLTTRYSTAIKRRIKSKRVTENSISAHLEFCRHGQFPLLLRQSQWIQVRYVRAGCFSAISSRHASGPSTLSRAHERLGCAKMRNRELQRKGMKSSLWGM